MLNSGFIINITKGVIFILLIKKSQRDDTYVVFNPHNFNLHTHTRHKRIALIVKNNVENHRIPKTNDLRLLYSHIRVTNNKRYIKQIEDKIASLSQHSLKLHSCYAKIV